MKIRSRSGKSQRRIVRPSGNSSSLKTNFSSVAKLAALLLAVAFLCNGYVYLNQKISETNRALVKVRAEESLVKREIEQQRLLLEELSSWRHIGAQCRKFHLGLQLPAPDQVSRFSVLPQVHARKLAEDLESPARTAVR